MGKPFWLFLLFCLAAAIPPAMAAIGVNVTDIPKLKEYPPVSQEVFEKTTKIIRQDNPYGDSRLSYEFRVPKEWSLNVQQAPIGGSAGSPLSRSVLTTIAKYISAPKNLQRSTISIEAQELAYEVSAKNWFINFIINNGYSLSGMTEKSPREIEAMYVALENDVTYVVRARAIMNGSRLIVVRYYLPQENYDEEKALQAQVMKSFRLLSSTAERIEKQETYGFLDQSYFNYPKSWRLKEKSILSIERMSALLTQEMTDRKTQILEGHIKIKVVSRLLKTTLAQEVENFRKDLKIPHYSIGPLIESVAYTYDPSVKIGKAQIYTLEPDDKVNMQAYEFLVAVMQGDDYFYITSLITPSREQDFYTWAKNMEAVRIVNESMRRSNVSMKVDPNDPYFDYLKEYGDDTQTLPPDPPQEQAE